MSRIATSILVLFAAISAAAAFSSTFVGSSRVAHSRTASSNKLTMKVVDIDSEEGFDKTISSSGSSLVIVDYSTTWCGPCKGKPLLYLKSG